MHPVTLRDRLRGVIQPAATASGGPAPAPVLTTDHARLSVASPADVLGGTWRSSGAARSLVVLRRYEPESTYGEYSIGALSARLQRASGPLALMGLADAKPPFVFFDLETTGLNGGAGTYAFLVGCARFEVDGALVIEQHLLTDVVGERAMLQAVAEHLGDAGALVTFNGKSFDAPLVETRYLFHRSDSPCAALPHLDMLHPARRFWGATTADGCSLGTLESKILGVTRMDDVPGFEIPGRYFTFVRTGDARPLEAVLEHNRLDLISLAGLTACMLSLIDAGPSAARDAHEALALGRTYERAGATGRAVDAFERVLVECGAAPPLRGIKAEALRALALEARRSRRYSLAAERWQQLIEVPGCPANVAREATEALAIHHEHRMRDLESARLFALRSLELNRASAWGDAVRHRLARIERKMVSERRPLFASLP